MFSSKKFETTKGLHIDDYEIFSGLAEDEILLQRNYKFEVINLDLDKQELTIILKGVES